MATTTNYSWTTPDDTALVKDGAAAIRSLGTAIDTTTKNLNPSTTLGDIEYRSSTANTNTRLGIGTTGQVLTVSGGVPSWATPAGGGGYTELATGTLSGATTTINSISGSYKDLILYVYDYVISSTGGAMFIRPNADSGANYSDTGVIMEGAAGTAVYTNNGGTEMYFTGYGGNTSSANNLHSTFVFYNYANTDAHKNYLINGTSFNTTASPTRFVVKNGMGVYRSTSAITSLVIHAGSNSFSAGTYYLYGVK
jgi:hypothetical protein